MLKTIEKPNEELSPYAPRIIKISVPKEKIGNVIGPGGKTIRSIIERTNVTLDIDDDGIVTIGSTNEDNAQEAIKIIEDITKRILVNTDPDNKDEVELTGSGQRSVCLITWNPKTQ